MMSYHHRKKRSHLPKNDKWCPSNVVYVDGSGVSGCHGDIESYPAKAESIGFHVRPWEDPTSIPVLIHGTWYYLLPDGTKRERDQRDLAPGDGELQRSGDPADLST